MPRRRCACDRCAKGEPERPGDCHLCWLFWNDQAYRRHWSDETLPRKRRKRPARLALPCVHLGQPIGEPACAGRQPRACAVHGRVTVSPCPKAAHSCEGGKGRESCPDYVARGGDAGPSLASAARTSASE